MSQEPRYLAIETSSPRLSLAVGKAHRVLREYQGPLEWRHAESLFGGMERLLRQVRWPVQSLTGVLVSTGPGSFTGIRIGLATARTLGQSLKIPVVGMSSLETLARGVLKPGGYACALIDALRGDVFAGVYTLDDRGKFNVPLKESRRRLSLDDLAKELSPFRRLPLLFVGGGAGIYKEKLKALGGPRWRFASPAEGFPRAGVLIQQGSDKLSKAHSASYQRVVPLYLRSAAAVERKKGKVTR